MKCIVPSRMPFLVGTQWMLVVSFVAIVTFVLQLMNNHFEPKVNVSLECKAIFCIVRVHVTIKRVI